VRHAQAVDRWTCPRCDREFARANQSHVCVPGCSVDECFADRPAVQRDIYDALPTIRVSGDRTAHRLKLGSVDEVDEQLRDWLTEAYAAAAG
jgi:hypothetical protein